MRPSRLQLPPGAWSTVLDCLCERFPAIGREAWRDRFERGRVLDARGDPLAPEAPYRVGAEVRYFREVADEPAIPFAETVLHADEHLVVALYTYRNWSFRRVRHAAGAMTPGEFA